MDTANASLQGIVAIFENLTFLAAFDMSTNGGTFPTTVSEFDIKEVVLLHCSEAPQRYHGIPKMKFVLHLADIMAL